MTMGDNTKDKMIIETNTNEMTMDTEMTMDGENDSM